jgi:hypothetical protein
MLPAGHLTLHLLLLPLLLLLLLLQPAVRVSAVEVEAKLKTRKVRSSGVCMYCIAGLHVLK